MTEKVQAIEQKPKKEKPAVLELLDETISFSIVIRHENRTLDVIAKMRVPGNNEMIQLLRDREVSYVQSKSDVDALETKAPTAAEANIAFFDKHVLSIMIDGQAPSEKVLDRIDAQYKVKGLVVSVGYLGVQVKENPVDESEKLSLEEIFGDEVTTFLVHKVYDEKQKKEVEIISKVVLRAPTANDRLKWDRAQVSQVLKDRGRKTQYQHNAIDALANSMILRIPEGITLGGTPCDSTNREEKTGWLYKLPYIYKFRVLDNLFSMASEKNG